MFIRNQPAAFVTNNDEKESAKGSSLYIVSKKGTVRSSCLNDDTREATAFLRPYAIKYEHPDGSTSELPAVGATPIEMNESGPVHVGHPITEILSVDNISEKPPETWIGEEENGKPWELAKRCAETGVTLGNMGIFEAFSKVDIPMNDPKIKEVSGQGTMNYWIWYGRFQ